MTLNQVISGYQQLNSGLRRWQYDPQRTEHCQRNGEQHDAAANDAPSARSGRTLSHTHDGKSAVL